MDPHTTFLTEDTALTLSFTKFLRMTHTTLGDNWFALHLQNQDRISAATAFVPL